MTLWTRGLVCGLGLGPAPGPANFRTTGRFRYVDLYVAKSGSGPFAMDRRTRLVSFQAKSLALPPDWHVQVDRPCAVARARGHADEAHPAAGRTPAAFRQDMLVFHLALPKTRPAIDRVIELGTSTGWISVRPADHRVFVVCRGGKPPTVRSSRRRRRHLAGTGQIQIQPPKRNLRRAGAEDKLILKSNLVKFPLCMGY